jgi:hypothetical protein
MRYPPDDVRFLFFLALTNIMKIEKRKEKEKERIKPWEYLFARIVGLVRR